MSRKSPVGAANLDRSRWPGATRSPVGGHHRGVPVDELRAALRARAAPDAVAGMQRYFPGGVRALGVGNGEVRALAYADVRAHPGSSAELIDRAEALLDGAEYHEEVLLAFALLHRAARRELDASFLDRSRGWLEGPVGNWAQCDDLCLKLLHPYLLGRPELVADTAAWTGSSGPWARRASCVAVVKLAGPRSAQPLPLTDVLDRADALLDDPDGYVQKGVGWLLKVAAQAHPDDVVDYLRARRSRLRRDTFRYAVEKLDPATRRELMGLR